MPDSLKGKWKGHQYILVSALSILFIFYISKNVFAGDEVVRLSKQGMILVPSGEFLMGSTEKDGVVGKSIGVDEIPQNKVYLKAFFIDKYEVTNRQYKEFVDKTGHVAPVDKYNSYYSWNGNIFPAEQEDIPVSYVSWYDADEYCRWKGKRLPTEAEWEKSARGTDGRQWPWGDNFNEKACNVKYTGAGEILPVTGMIEDVSPYGVIGMCGNLSEWTDSWYLPYPGSSLKRESFGETYKVVRGGSWIMVGLPYSRSAYRANTYHSDYKNRGVGFRCAKDVDEK
ncbi:MAG: SUMF1/EgtB/PvdO family nonheme iron enzyme [Nitrospirae bacterium]|nr:SUMF1/EgtB/PvdO family nonheme iron enzyme [Nitrospirota bacterium]